MGRLHPVLQPTVAGEFHVFLADFRALGVFGAAAVIAAFAVF